MRNLKISTKLLLLVCLSTAIIIFIGWYGITNIIKTNLSLETVYKDRVIPLQQLKIISDMYAVNIVDAAHKMSNRNIGFSEGRNMIREARTAIEAQWETYLSTYLTQEEQKLVDQALELMANADRSIEKLQTIVASDDSTSRADLKVYIVQNLYQEIDPITEVIGKLVDLQLKVAGQEYDQANVVLTTTRRNSMLVILAGIILAAAFSYFIIRDINQKIKNAVEAVEKLARGDLVFALQTGSKDEIGTLMNNLHNLKDKLNQVITRIRLAADSILAASTQLNASSQEMAQGSNEQAASAEEVSSSMEEMAANIQQNTDYAQETEKIALVSAKDVDRGSSAVNQTTLSMQEIAGKITIISEIARQTNILALNAAVEAARAGEHGKGFAVVAQEVRKLAEKSQASAAEIDRLSKSSVSVAVNSEKLLRDIVPNIQKTAQLVQEISSSSIEQNSGAEQINRAIQQLNQVIQQNATTSEEMATASVELSRQAEDLIGMVDYFKVTISEETKHSSANKSLKLNKLNSTTVKAPRGSNR